MIIAILGALAALAGGFAIAFTRALGLSRGSMSASKRYRGTRSLTVGMTLSWGLTAGLGSAALYQVINAFAA